jgi:carbamoyl-phosphate synthase large subunit
LLYWPLEEHSPNTLSYLQQGKIDLVINIPKNYQEDELTTDYLIRRQAADHGISLITNLQLAQRFVEALGHKRLARIIHERSSRERQVCVRSGRTQQ